MNLSKYRFYDGIRDGLPICFGYFSVSFAFGIFAITNGLSIWEAVLISMTNLTSAGQLAAVPIIASGGSLIELASCQLIINIRYSLMSIILSQKVDDKVSFLDKLWIAFGNTDEVFAVSSSKDGPVGKSYMFGLILTPFFGWSLGTLCGAIAGDILPELVTSALGVAIYGMFIAIVLPSIKKEKNMLYCVTIAVILSVLFHTIDGLKSISGGFVIIICAITAAFIMAIIAPIKEVE